LDFEVVIKDSLDQALEVHDMDVSKHYSEWKNNSMEETSDGAMETNFNTLEIELSKNPILKTERKGCNPVCSWN
jgi:hypothetical protein